MSITTDPTGRRRVSVSVEVSGSQEEVWEAVASGPGISGWFLPTELQLGFDGEPARLVVHLGPHTSRAAEIKEWEPLSRFRAVAEDLPGSGPPLWTEWTVEPLALGCRVQVEHWLETHSDEWDSLLAQAAEGWSGFFRVLSVYLGYFSGKRCQACTLLITTPDPVDKAWETLAEPLGLYRAVVGERVKSEMDAPILAGVLEFAGDESSPYQALLRCDEPAPGIACLQIARMHGWNVPTVRLYFYGEQSAITVSREEPHWQAWLSQLFSS